jgi:hypothetical protein
VASGFSWKIPHDGQPPTRIGALSLQSLPNGIVHHRDFVYAADFRRSFF